MLFPVLQNNWLDNAFDDFFDTRALSRMNATAPAVNVKESDKAYTMEVAVPGIKQEFCRVTINNDGDLVLAIENKFEHKEENKNEHFLRREFSYGNYQQTYTLPENVDKDSISAKVENGVLTITMPKLAEKVGKVQRQIAIA